MLQRMSCLIDVAKYQQSILEFLVFAVHVLLSQWWASSNSDLANAGQSFYTCAFHCSVLSKMSQRSVTK